MSWLEAILLGVVQGLTEFIPISSDGHLSAAEMLMPQFGQVGLLFDVMVHVGTLTAVLIYYRALLRAEAAGLVSADPQKRRTMRSPCSFIATLPTAVVGCSEAWVGRPRAARFVGGWRS
jgi:undecaprenyl-diphosphatase